MNQERQDPIWILKILCPRSNESRAFLAKVRIYVQMKQLNFARIGIKKFSILSNQELLKVESNFLEKSNVLGINESLISNPKSSKFQVQ